jgi:hypothetical protein
MVISTPKDTNGPDFLGWRGTNTLQFIVQSAYNLKWGNILPLREVEKAL